jgi:hypothetical protein
MGAKGASRVGFRGAAAGERRDSASLLLGAAVLSALALVFFGGGCAGPKTPAKRTVVFWQFSPLTAVQPILAKFEAENPTIHVEVEQLTWQSGREKIVAAIAAGARPTAKSARRSSPDWSRTARCGPFQQD